MNQLETVRCEDTGTEIKKDLVEDGVAVDLSTAINMVIIFRAPDGTTTSIPAEKRNPPGTDGQIRGYSLVTTWPADKPGRWLEQFQWEDPGRSPPGTWSGPFESRMVEPKLQ